MTNSQKGDKNWIVKFAKVYWEPSYKKWNYGCKKLQRIIVDIDILLAFKAY